MARRTVVRGGSGKDHRGEYHDGAGFRQAAVRGARVERGGPERDDPSGVGSSVGLPSRAVGCSCATRVSPVLCREVCPCSDARCLGTRHAASTAVAHGGGWWCRLRLVY